MFQVNASIVLVYGLTYLFAPGLNARLPIVGSSFQANEALLGDRFAGAVQVGFGICSLLALTTTTMNKYYDFKAVLLFQCIYKTTFLVVMALEYVTGVSSGPLSPFEWHVLAVFAFFSIGNGVALYEDFKLTSSLSSKEKAV